MIRIKIPASTANLGSGFDSLGIALSLYNYVEMEEAEGCFISDKNKGEIPTKEDNLIYLSAKKVYEKCGAQFTGLRIVEENRIPFARGLGSSSACIAGGVVGANELLGKPFTKDELLDIAAKIEGHPDNVSPAIMGGFTVNVMTENKVFYVKQELPESLVFAAFVPPFELKTSDARAVMPTEISHRDAVFNLSRSALITASLITGKYENLKLGAEDRLHQPYRISLIPGGEKIIDRCYEKGALAAFISGAGSTVAAIFRGKKEEITPIIEEILSQSEFEAWKYFALTADNSGTEVL